MKYKVGDEVLVKAKIVDVDNNGYYARPINGQFTFWFENKNIVENPDVAAEEAWEIAKKLKQMNKDELLEAFRTNVEYLVLRDFTPQQAKGKIEAWEQDKKINVGDVVDHNGEIGIVTNTDDEEGFYNVLYSNGSTSAHDCRNLKKTDRHIDITGLLDQIGGTDA